MLHRIRPTKLSIAILCVVAAGSAGVLSVARAMTAPTDCDAEVAAWVAAYDALQDAIEAETDAAYAVQEAQSALDAAQLAMIACEGSGGGSGSYDTPTHELAVSILED